MAVRFALCGLVSAAVATSTSMSHPARGGHGVGDTAAETCGRVHACARAWVRARVRASVRVRVGVYVSTRWCARMHARSVGSTTFPLELVGACLGARPFEARNRWSSSYLILRIDYA